MADDIECDDCNYHNKLWYLRYQKAQMKLINNQGYLWDLKRKIKAEERLTELKRRLKTLDLHHPPNNITFQKYHREIEGLEKEIKKQ